MYVEGKEWKGRAHLLPSFLPSFFALSMDAGHHHRTRISPHGCQESSKSKLHASEPTRLFGGRGREVEERRGKGAGWRSDGKRGSSHLPFFCILSFKCVEELYDADALLRPALFFRSLDLRPSLDCPLARRPSSRAHPRSRSPRPRSSPLRSLKPQLRK